MAERYVSSLGNPFFFTGRRLYMLETLPEADPAPVANQQLQHNRARHYSPLEGRWLQRDPMGYLDGLNSYEYVQSQSTNFQDATGWFCWGRKHICEEQKDKEELGPWQKAYALILGDIETMTGSGGVYVVTSLNAYEKAAWVRSYRKVYKCKIGCNCVLIYGTPGCRSTTTQSSRTDHPYGAWAQGIGADFGQALAQLLGGFSCGGALEKELEKLIEKEFGKKAKVPVLSWAAGTQNEAPAPDSAINGKEIKRSELPPDLCLKEGKQACNLDVPNANHIFDLPSCPGGSGCK